MNPMAMMRLKPLLEKFKSNHPKVPLFFSAASGYVGEGSIIEMTVTAADGRSLCTNMKVTADDLELLHLLQDQMRS